jgi:hypothetical protein
MNVSLAATLSFALAACTSTDNYSFVGYGKQPSPAGASNRETVVLNDQLALLYASNVATVLRCRFTGARITREISSSLQVILAGLAGAGAAFNFGESTLAVLGLGSAAIPEFQGIFNAKGRAECYQDAVRLIEEAQIDYLAHNQRPSPDYLTQNGVTLFQRVTSSIHVVEKTLAGHLPSVQDMQKATEPMSGDGAKKTSAGAKAFNLIPANGSAPVQKLAPVVIEKNVIHSVGLQSEQVRAIAEAAATLLKNPNLTSEQAQAVADHLKIVVGDGQEPHEALSQALGESNISAAKAADILKELQKQVPQ